MIDKEVADKINKDLVNYLYHNIPRANGKSVNTCYEQFKKMPYLYRDTDNAIAILEVTNEQQENRK